MEGEVTADEQANHPTQACWHDDSVVIIGPHDQLHEARLSNHAQLPRSEATEVTGGIVVPLPPAAEDLVVQVTRTEITLPVETVEGVTLPRERW